MDLEQRQLIEWQLARLNYDWAYGIDHAEYESVLNLFTPDALFGRLGVVHSGHDQIRKGLQIRRPMTSRHLLTNLHFTDVTPTTAQGAIGVIAYLGDVPSGSEPSRSVGGALVLDFEDQYVRTDERWKLASRVVHVAISAAGVAGN